MGCALPLNPCGNQLAASTIIESRGQRGVKVTDEEIDLLRSALERAYEKRQPFFLRVMQAVKTFFGLRRPRKLIESLNIEEKKDAA
jgi:hypothetical protein